MTRYVWTGDTWVPAPPCSPPGRARAGLVAPMLIRDHMAPVQHPVTGEILDSKSAFRARTRDAGCVELGNDAPVESTPYAADRKQIRADIVTAMQQSEQGYRAEAQTTLPGEVRTYGK